MFDKQKLQELLDFVKKIEVEDKDSCLEEKKESKIPLTSNEKEYKIFEHAVKLMGFANAPKIVSEQTFDGQVQAKPIYRGVSSVNNLEDLLCSENFYMGSGVFGDGIYTTNNYNRAYKDYARRRSTNLLKLKLSDDAKIVDRDQFFELVDDLVKLVEISEKEKSGASASGEDIVKSAKNIIEKAASNGVDKKICVELAKLIGEVKNYEFFMEKVVKAHSSTLAVLAGIDALSVNESAIDSYDSVMMEMMQKPSNRDENYFLIFNRGKMVVKKDDFDYIRSLCGHEKPVDGKKTTQFGE